MFFYTAWNSHAKCDARLGDWKLGPSSLLVLIHSRSTWAPKQNEKGLKKKKKLYCNFGDISILCFQSKMICCSFVTLARLVDFPTPFTPQKVMTKGLRWLWASITSRRMSTLLFGCRICTSESCRACFTVEATAANTQSHDQWVHQDSPVVRSGDQLRSSTHWWRCPSLCPPVFWLRSHRAGRRYQLLHSWLEMSRRGMKTESSLNTPGTGGVMFASYQWGGPSFSPVLTPCPHGSGSWSPPGPSASQTCHRKHPSSLSWKGTTKLLSFNEQR